MSFIPSAATTFQDLSLIRSQAPLVHNITNFVVMQQTANALLALGASPVMAHAEEEIADMAKLAGAVVVNMGTLDADWVKRMKLAVSVAGQLKRPCVFDPVGAGATPYRTRVAQEMVRLGTPLIIRGNASEIMALANEGNGTKGVTSLYQSSSARDAGRRLVEQYGHAVVISGETDLILTSEAQVSVHNGDAMMTRVTGMGCTATALIGAFSAVNANALMASVHAMVTLGVAAEIAMLRTRGPGSFYIEIRDALYLLTQTELSELAKMEYEKGKVIA